jgi:hypothetical protein
MNAESTYVRPVRPRPTLVPPPGGDGARLAATVLALPLRVAATPLGRRVLAAATAAVLLVSLVGALYDHTDRPGAAATDALAGAQATASRQADPAAPRRGEAAPAAAKRTGGAAEAAAAWFAGRQRVALDQVRALQQRRVSDSERQVLVVAEAGASKLPSAYVTVRKGPGGWAAVS